MRLAMRPLHVALFVAVMAIWGLNFVVAKIGLLQLPPLLMIALRWGLVAVMMLPFVKPPRGHWREVMLVSITLGFVHFALMFTGLRDIDASTAAIAIQLQVPFAALLSAVIFKDAIGWRRALGLAIAFVGVALIAAEPRLDGHYLALTMVISAACIWSVANIQIKLMGDVDGLTLIAWIGHLRDTADRARAPTCSRTARRPRWRRRIGAPGPRSPTRRCSWSVSATGPGTGCSSANAVNQVMPFMLLMPAFGAPRASPSWTSR